MSTDVRSFTLADVFDQAPLTDEDKAEFKAALCTRGKRKGLLKKHSPPCDKPGFAGWQALIGAVQPARLSFAGLIFAHRPVKEQYARLDKWVEDRPRFRAYLNANGQRPFEFNLFALTGHAG